MDQQQQIDNIKTEVNDLRRMVMSLQNASEIDPHIVKSFTEAIAGNLLAPDSKSASSEDQSVDEGGVATYAVLRSPDGFSKSNGKYYPYYN